MHRDNALISEGSVEGPQEHIGSTRGACFGSRTNSKETLSFSSKFPWPTLHRTQMTWCVKGLGSTQVALLVYVEPFNMIWGWLGFVSGFQKQAQISTWSSKHQNQLLVDDLLIMPLFWVYDPRIISKALHFLCSTYMLQAEKKARLIIFLINVIYLAPCRFSCLIRLYELQEIGILV